MKSFLLSLSLLLVGASCQHASLIAADGLVIRNGTSAGICVGYCSAEVEITATEARYTRWSREPVKHPRQVRTIAISQAEWDALRGSVDPDVLASLRDVYGCPDCADGGAEWVEVESPQIAKRVTVEAGADIPEIRQLLQRVRSIRMRAEGPRVR